MIDRVVDFVDVVVLDVVVNLLAELLSVDSSDVVVIS